MGDSAEQDASRCGAYQGIGNFDAGFVVSDEEASSCESAIRPVVPHSSFL